MGGFSEWLRGKLLRQGLFTPTKPYHHLFPLLEKVDFKSTLNHFPPPPFNTATPQRGKIPVLLDATICKRSPINVINQPVWYVGEKKILKWGEKKQTKTAHLHNSPILFTYINIKVNARSPLGRRWRKRKREEYHKSRRKWFFLGGGDTKRNGGGPLLCAQFCSFPFERFETRDKKKKKHTLCNPPTFFSHVLYLYNQEDKQERGEIKMYPQQSNKPIQKFYTFRVQKQKRKRGEGERGVRNIKSKGE